MIRAFSFGLLLTIHMLRFFQQIARDLKTFLIIPKVNAVFFFHFNDMLHFNDRLFFTLMTGFAIRHKEAEENEKKRV